MKKNILNFIIGVLIAILIFIINKNYISIFSRNFLIQDKRIVIIDAGHGGIDGGAVSKSGTSEKDINLSISKMLKGYLESSGYTCIMIRETDEGLYEKGEGINYQKNDDLKKRKDMIKAEDEGMFVSIHLNSFPQSQYYGAQVFYHHNSEESKKLAKCVQDSLINLVDKSNTREEKSSNSYYLLRDNKIPSIIVECGFLSNQREAELLKDEEYQNKIAFAVFAGIERYYNGKEQID